MQNNNVVINSQSWEDILFNQNSFYFFEQGAEKVKSWFLMEVFEKDSIYEMTLLLIMWVIANIISRYFCIKLDLVSQSKSSVFFNSYSKFSILITPFIFFCFCTILYTICKIENIDNSIITICIHFIMVWIPIKLLSILTSSSLKLKFIISCVWIFLILNITNLLTPVLNLLANWNLNVFQKPLSMLDVLITFIICYLLFTIAFFLTYLLTKKIERNKEISDSTKQLMIITFKCSIWFIITIIALQDLGLNLSVLKFFSGALGIGLGFGLKNIIANLVAGILLLLDKSIAIGDVIVIDDIKGIITEYNARCTTIITREGMEYLIPNEKFMSSNILNLTYSSPKIRVRIPIAIAYESDVKKAMKILNDIATEDKRILKNPAPKTRIRKLADSSITIESRIWVSDPGAGTGKLKSNFLLKVLERFKSEGISIPYPRRDIYFYPNNS